MQWAIIYGGRATRLPEKWPEDDDMKTAVFHVMVWGPAMTPKTMTWKPRFFMSWVWVPKIARKRWHENRGFSCHGLGAGMTPKPMTIKSGQNTVLGITGKDCLAFRFRNYWEKLPSILFYELVGKFAQHSVLGLTGKNYLAFRSWN